MVLKQKQIVDELKVEWNKLWRERIDDKVRAEGIAINDYNSLFIDKGTIIHATRDFKTLNFREILEQHEISDVERYIPPSPHIGGWTKFVKTHISNQPPPRKRLAELYKQEKRQKQQLKKNGRGWLHI